MMLKEHQAHNHGKHDIEWFILIYVPVSEVFCVSLYTGHRPAPGPSGDGEQPKSRAAAGLPNPGSW